MSSVRIQGVDCQYQVLVCHCNLFVHFYACDAISFFPVIILSFITLLWREETEILHTINFDLLETLNYLPLYCCSIDTVILYEFC